MTKEPKSQKTKTSAKDKKEDATKSASFPGLVDLVRKDQKVQYLIATHESLKIVPEHVDSNGKMLRPPEKIKAIPFAILNSDQILPHITDGNHVVYCEVLERLKQIAVLPSEEHYHLLVVYIFFTHLQEQFSYFPFLHFFGPPERGKSRIMKAVINLSYRGFRTETLNPAYIFRLSEHFKATIGIDVYDLLNRAIAKDSFDLLLCRFERGAKAPRVIDYSKGPFEDTVYYSVQGPTVLATNVDIPVTNPLRSRCIQILMPEARGKYPNNNSPDLLTGLEAQLLAFRARHLINPLAEIEKPVEGRLGDIMHPLVTVASLLPEGATEALLGLIGDMERSRKEDQRQTLAGRTAQGLYNLRALSIKGQLTVGGLTKKLNSDKMKRQVSLQTVGRVLRGEMGIIPHKTMGKMHIIWDMEMMEAIWRRYGIKSNSGIPNLPIATMAQISGREDNNELPLSPFAKARQMGIREFREDRETQHQLR